MKFRPVETELFNANGRQAGRQVGRQTEGETRRN